MKAFEWLGKDGYDCFICCTKEETMEIVSILQAKSLETNQSLEGIEKYDCFVLNTREKIITPGKKCTWLSHPEWWSPLVRKKLNIVLVIEGYSLRDSASSREHSEEHNDKYPDDMEVYEWLAKDGYDCYIVCREEVTEDIVSIFGSRAEGFSILYPVADSPKKYYRFVLNTKDKIITPIKNGIWISHPDWFGEYVGKERSISVILDRYSLYDCMYPC